MHIERILKALANKRRLAIIKLLDARELTVTEIALKIQLSVKATSKHLQTLARTDILEHKQKSLTVHYHVSEPAHPLVRVALTNL